LLDAGDFGEDGVLAGVDAVELKSGWKVLVEGTYWMDEANRREGRTEEERFYGGGCEDMEFCLVEKW